MSTPTSSQNGGGHGQQPLRSAMKPDEENITSKAPLPTCSSPKVVQIAAPEPQQTEAQTKRQYSANLAKRLSGRPTLPISSSRTSMTSLSGQDLIPSPGEITDEAGQLSKGQIPPQQSRRQHQYLDQKLLSQISDWLQHERRKKEVRERHKSDHHRYHLHHHRPFSGKKAKEEKDDAHDEEGGLRLRARTDSIDSQSSDVDLDKLQRILEEGMSALGLDSIPHLGPKLSRRSSMSRHRKSGSRTLLQRAPSSDTDYVDGDAVVPSCEAILDNTKTLSYNAGKSSDNLSATGKAEAKEKEAWATFRNEIIRLAHTLRIKGWRRIPLESGDRISVQRLSGALTNAVYVVSPPSDLEFVPGKRTPNKLLLRIYGPQVEHLIDRENELSVLRRLARKKIGPRLLGTFTNGRFEQYFNSTTLTPANLREPETYRQIAKRMRELHDGIELLEHERAAGPAVWKNWDKWLANVEKRVTALDNETKARSAASGPGSGPGTGRCASGLFQGPGYVCCVEWPLFKATVDKYRTYLSGMYRGVDDIRARLVFAHNDTQYGNILRVRPDDEKSPLLQPANEHKQLVVIDFEYAAANVPGMEFANHFTEWCYNYHDAAAPHAIKSDRYPSVEHQRRFVKAYVDHRSQFPHAGSTPRLTPVDTPGGGGGGGGSGGGTSTGSGGPTTPCSLPPTSSSSSIVDFMLDARVPSGSWKEEEELQRERQREEQTDQAVAELLEEARLWRPANSAFWVAWGLVQAKLPGLDLGDCDNEGDAAEAGSEGSGVSMESQEEADEFDYLGYVQERALFFWGDCILLGLVKAEELPEEVRARLKFVER